MATLSGSPTSPKELRPSQIVWVHAPTHRPGTYPGEMLLEEFLKPLGISQSVFAIRLGVSFRGSMRSSGGKRAVTLDTALRLSRALGTPRLGSRCGARRCRGIGRRRTGPAGTGLAHACSRDRKGYMRRKVLDLSPSCPP
ncbi:MAG TPA: HigA family addiction module antitoxin [Thermoanaerobaculia bacterium]|nr:HigA family addiction module antitoxin [Thermoanaerobaculia bacterium]